LNNTGTLTLDGAFCNNSPLNNYGAVDIDDGGILSNTGAVGNYGTLTIYGGGYLSHWNLGTNCETLEAVR
jgi:hypothetical protein